MTAPSSLSCSFPCHGSWLHHSQQKVGGRGRGGRQESGRTRERETATRWELQSYVITEVTSQHVCRILLVRSKVPVPPTLKRRWLYKGVAIRKWGPRGASFVSLPQQAWPLGCLSDALFCLTLAFCCCCWTSVHRIQFIRTSLRGIAALEFSSRILETLFSKKLQRCYTFCSLWIETYVFMNEGCNFRPALSSFWLVVIGQQLLTERTALSFFSSSASLLSG